MDDIRRRDTRIFVRRLFSGAFWLLVIFTGLAVALAFSGVPVAALVIGLVLFAVIHAVVSYNRSIDERFHDARLHDQWKHCQDRVKRMRQSLRELKDNQVADLSELPKNVDRLSADLYIALRRADAVMYEAGKSEGRLTKPQTVTIPATPDRQAQDLLRQADRNIAEYNAHMQKLMASVQRTEAQVMVFITTLDSLRARMLTYRAAPRPAEVDNKEFLTAIQEAKMQFDAIDKALDELDAPVAAQRLVVTTTDPLPVTDPDVRMNLGSLGPPPIPTHAVPNLGSLGPAPEKPLVQGVGESPTGEQE